MLKEREKDYMKEKFSFTGERKQMPDGTIVGRIQAEMDFGLQKKGDLGGFLGSKDNLSQKGNCWVDCDACVYGNAQVLDNALVCGKAEVFGSAKISGNVKIKDNSKVSGNANISNNSQISGNADIAGNASICEDAVISGNVKIRGRISVSDNAKIDVQTGQLFLDGTIGISTDADITSENDIIIAGPINGCSYPAFYRDCNGGISVRCEAVRCKIDNLHQEMEDTYGTLKDPESLDIIVMMAKSMLKFDKYGFTGETKECNGIVLKRIVALRNFGQVTKGDIGGWIEKRENLSQSDTCWIFDEACVYGDAKVDYKAEVSMNAEVSGFAEVSGKARISGNAKITDYAKVFGATSISGDTVISGNAVIRDYASVQENVNGDTIVGGYTVMPPKKS